MKNSQIQIFLLLATISFAPATFYAYNPEEPQLEVSLVTIALNTANKNKSTQPGYISSESDILISKQTILKQTDFKLTIANFANAFKPATTGFAEKEKEEEEKEKEEEEETTALQVATQLRSPQALVGPLPTRIAPVLGAISLWSLFLQPLTTRRKTAMNSYVLPIPVASILASYVDDTFEQAITISFRHHPSVTASPLDTWDDFEGKIKKTLQIRTLFSLKKNCVPKNVTALPLWITDPSKIILSMIFNNVQVTNIPELLKHGAAAEAQGRKNYGLLMVTYQTI